MLSKRPLPDISPQEILDTESSIVFFHPSQICRVIYKNKYFILIYSPINILIQLKAII